MDDKTKQALAELKFAIADKLGREPTTPELLRAAIKHTRLSLLRVVK
jgi:hypothetical protein